MKKLLLLATFLSILGIFSVQKTNAAYIRGYYRSNGTYVSPYFRSSANSYLWDNYSYKPSYRSSIYNYGYTSSLYRGSTYRSLPNSYNWNSSYWSW